MPYWTRWTKGEVRVLRSMITKGMTNEQIFNALVHSSPTDYRGDNAIRQRIQIEKRKLRFTKTKRHSCTPPVPELVATKRKAGRPRKTQTYNATLDGLLKAVQDTVTSYLKTHSI